MGPDDIRRSDADLRLDSQRFHRGLSLGQPPPKRALASQSLPLDEKWTGWDLNPEYLRTLARSLFTSRHLSETSQIGTHDPDLLLALRVAPNDPSRRNRGTNRSLAPDRDNYGSALPSLSASILSRLTTSFRYSRKSSRSSSLISSGRMSSSRRALNRVSAPSSCLRYRFRSSTLNFVFSSICWR